MNEYEEIMNSAKYNIVTQIDRAYHQGYEDGKKASCDCKDNMENEYSRGLNEAWEAARKIHDGQIPYEVFGLDKTGNGFTYASPLNWGETISVQEVIAKIKEYEEQKQGIIQVGDEVFYMDENDLRVVVRITNQMAVIQVTKDGKCVGNHVKELHKTGRTFPQIAEVLNEMRGDEHEHQKTDRI